MSYQTSPMKKFTCLGTLLGTLSIQALFGWGLCVVLVHWLFEGHDNPQQEETTQATESAINATMDAERSCTTPQSMGLPALRSAFAAHAAAVDITPTQPQ